MTVEIRTPLHNLRDINPETRAKLGEIGIATCEELARASREFLTSRLSTEQLVELEIAVVRAGRSLSWVKPGDGW